MEALAMNVPVVSTIVGAVEEILTDGLNGYLIEPKEDMKEQFASKVSALINNDSLYQSLSKNTRKTLREDFSLPVMSSRYKEIFDELAGRRSN